MQREISNNVKIGNLVTPFQNVEKSPTFNNSSSDFDNANLKVKKKIRRLIEYRIYNADIARYIPGMLDLVFRGMIEKTMRIEQPTGTVDKEVLDFELILDNNYYTNFKSLHLCFPIRFT